MMQERSVFRRKDRSTLPAPPTASRSISDFVRNGFSIFLFVLVLSATSLRGAAATEEDSVASGSPGRASTQAAVDALQQWYLPRSGLYRTTGWWNSANAITALANYSRVRRTEEFLPVFANTLHAAQSSPHGARGFINHYYDDEGWWALAWIDVYDLTHDAAYLRMADSIFSDMKLGWDETSCGGGVWWSKDNKEKNAIDNELFLAVSASLANREADEVKRNGDLQWARKEWKWFRQSGMINSENLVNDGLDLSDGAHCRNNGNNTWTYNQGVILGGLVELDKADPDPRLKEIAASIALAAIAHLAGNQGILQETSPAHTGGDVAQFKGIFARNLMILNGAHPDSRFQAFFRANAVSILKYDQDGSNHFGFWWTGPFDSADAARQSSALDLLIAAEALNSDQ